LKARFARTRLSSSATLATAVLLVSSVSLANHEVLMLTAADASTGDAFGGSVAMDGDRIIVGAHGAPVPSNTGAAYVFDASSGQQLLKLVHQDAEPKDWFGFSVSISGSRAVIGAHGNDDPRPNAGSAYVFDTSSGAQLFKLLPSDVAEEDRFGSAVAVSGNLAVVASASDDDNGPDSGSVYVFDVTSGQELFKLLPADGAANFMFGYSVAVDGNLAVIGTSKLSGYGAAYVFDVTTGQELFKLQPANPKYGDLFGSSVAIDGDRAVVGAHWRNGYATKDGAAYVFDVTTGQVLQKLIPPPCGHTGKQFGYSVAVDGDRVIGGAWLENGVGFGYAFDTASGRRLFRMKHSDPDHADHLGVAAALDGGRAVLGASSDNHAATDAGAAYVFDIVETGSGYCFGDPGAGTPCPCSNDNDGSIPGSGCANGGFASGAQLAGCGTANVSADALVLVANNVEPDQPGLFFQAEHDLSPGLAWGDGLRCAGGHLKRLEVVFADCSGAATSTIGISAKAGNVSPGSVKYYQYWYRTPLSSVCGSFFNTTNGVVISWLP